MPVILEKLDLKQGFFPEMYQEHFTGVIMVHFTGLIMVFFCQMAKEVMVGN